MPDCLYKKSLDFDTVCFLSDLYPFALMVNRLIQNFALQRCNFIISVVHIQGQGSRQMVILENYLDQISRTSL